MLRIFRKNLFFLYLLHQILLKGIEPSPLYSRVDLGKFSHFPNNLGYNEQGVSITTMFGWIWRGGPLFSIGLLHNTLKNSLILNPKLTVFQTFQGTCDLTKMKFTVGMYCNDWCFSASGRNVYCFFNSVHCTERNVEYHVDLYHYSYIYPYVSHTNTWFELVLKGELNF